MVGRHALQFVGTAGYFPANRGRVADDGRCGSRNTPPELVLSRVPVAGGAQIGWITAQWFILQRFSLQPAMFAARGAVLLLAWAAHGQAQSVENKAESWKKWPFRPSSTQ